MRRTRRTEITVETHQILKVKRCAHAVCAWCPPCAAQVTMLRPEEAAVWAATSTRTIYQWVEAGRVHFTETPDRMLLICRNSLPASPVTDR